MAQTLKTKEQTNFSSYSSKACVIMYSNKHGLVSSVSEATLALFIFCCYFAKNEKNLLCYLPEWKRQRSVGLERKKLRVFFTDRAEEWHFQVPVQTTDHYTIPACGWKCLARCGGLLHARHYWVVTDKTFCCYTHTGNGNHLKSRVMNKDTARMFAGWVVATRHLPRNLRYAHLSRPYQKLFPSLCTVIA
jgi:hypothetical protein